MAHSRASLTNARDQLQNLWWVRCLLATEHDKLGLILRSALAMPTDRPPWYGPSAIIDREGYVLTNYVETNRQHKPTVGYIVCELQELRDNLNRLADQQQLTDLERLDLFDKVFRQWIKADARPTTEQAEDRIPAEYRKH